LSFGAWASGVAGAGFDARAADTATSTWRPDSGAAPDVVISAPWWMGLGSPEEAFGK
jgi:hypothetical protein